MNHRDALPALSDERIDVLTTRAGGHAVGAPTTRDEERSMALEIQVRRRKEKESQEALVVGLKEIADELSDYAIMGPSKSDLRTRARRLVTALQEKISRS